MVAACGVSASSLVGKDGLFLWNNVACTSYSMVKVKKFCLILCFEGLFVSLCQFFANLGRIEIADKMIVTPNIQIVVARLVAKGAIFGTNNIIV